MAQPTAQSAAPLHLLFLGTGAADWPAQIDDDVPASERAEARRHSSLLVDGRLLLDCGGGVEQALAEFDQPPQAITDVFLTHTHADHMSAEVLQWLADVPGRSGRLQVWCESGAANHVPPISGADRRLLHVGLPVELDGYEILPLAANHRVSESTEQTLHFRIRKEGAAAFYATDGAWLLKDTVAALMDVPLDAIVWDATIGNAPDDYRIFEHNSLAMLRLMKESLKNQGVLTDATQIILTHLARTLHPSHRSLAPDLIQEGLLVAYDGMTVELAAADG